MRESSGSARVNIRQSTVVTPPDTLPKDPIRVIIGTISMEVLSYRGGSGRKASQLKPMAEEEKTV